MVKEWFFSLSLAFLYFTWIMGYMNSIDPVFGLVTFQLSDRADCCSHFFKVVSHFSYVNRGILSTTMERSMFNGVTKADSGSISEN